MPPLRERPADVEALAVHFLAECRPDVSFTHDALELLMQQPWPGNVRELRNVVTKLGVFANSPCISAEYVFHHLIAATPAMLKVADTSIHATTLIEIERATIVRALESTGGNQSLAAAQLGVPRRTFCRKLNEYHITLGRRQGIETLFLRRRHENRRTRLNVPVLQTNGGECTSHKLRTKHGWHGFTRCPGNASTVEARVTLTFSLLGPRANVDTRRISRMDSA